MRSCMQENVSNLQELAAEECNNEKLHTASQSPNDECKHHGQIHSANPASFHTFGQMKMLSIYLSSLYGRAGYA